MNPFYYHLSRFQYLARRFFVRNKKTAASTRQRRLVSHVGNHVRTQGAVTPPPPGVCRLTHGRQPAPQAISQVRRWYNMFIALITSTANGGEFTTKAG
jgi:hypothetical protein